jgi:hypothetical protein
MEMRYINLYDDEGNDFYIETDCPSIMFKELLDNYRAGEIKGYEDVIENGYNYDDFFKILKSKGFKLKVVKTNESYFF